MKAIFPKCFFSINSHGANLVPAFFHWQRASTTLVMICGLAAVNVRASLLAGWDMSTLPGGTGVWGASPLSPTDNDANLSIGGLTRGSGILTPSGSSAAAKAWGGTGFVTANNTEALAISGGQFATFTLAANSGYQLSIASISPYNIRRSGTGPTTGIWQYEIGAGAFIDIGSAITWGTTTSAAGNSESAIDLSTTSALQNIAAGTVVTFRVVDWGSTGTAGTWYFNDTGTTADDLAINGTVSAVPGAVPEPAEWGMISALGLLGICGVGTWRKHCAAKRAILA